MIGSIPVRASLQIEAASARYRLTDTTTLFLKGFDADAGRVLQSAVSVPKGAHEDAFWSDLIAGALQVRNKILEILVGHGVPPSPECVSIRGNARDTCF